ncbi:MAG: GNAT family N-acetyltransferase [Promethearchaeota archaeon]
MPIKFELGCEPNEFSQYYAEVLEKAENRKIGLRLFKQNPDQLIIWREDAVIVGHALWHKASTDEHRKGDSRNPDDQAMLRKLFGGKIELVELHEVWLKQTHRGKGYGSEFFKFFEILMRTRGHTEIAYYAYNPVALAICRKRGYQEGCCLEQPGFEGNVERTYVFRISL